MTTSSWLLLQQSAQPTPSGWAPAALRAKGRRREGGGGERRALSPEPDPVEHPARRDVQQGVRGHGGRPWLCLLEYAGRYDANEACWDFVAGPRSGPRQLEGERRKLTFELLAVYSEYPPHLICNPLYAPLTNSVARAGLADCLHPTAKHSFSLLAHTISSLIELSHPVSLFRTSAAQSPGAVTKHSQPCSRNGRLQSVFFHFTLYFCSTACQSGWVHFLHEES